MTPPEPTSPLAGREIVVAVCGGIACYKVADVVSKLVQAGAGVTVCMSDSATRFVAPLTFAALCGRPVRTGAWDMTDSADPQHIALTERADLMLVAPATADVMAKTVTGVCDGLIPLMISAAACPVVFAPSMNNRMWEHPATRRNVQQLRDWGYAFIGPETGWLACRNVGAGRLSEPAKIVEQVTRLVMATGAGFA